MSPTQRRALRSLGIGPQEIGGRLRAWLLGSGLAEAARWSPPPEETTTIADPAGPLVRLTESGRDAYSALLTEDADKTRRTNRAARAFWSRRGPAR